MGRRLERRTDTVLCDCDGDEGHNSGKLKCLFQSDILYNFDECVTSVTELKSFGTARVPMNVR